MDKKILSISDAASILGVSDETLRNWEREGKLTPFHTEGGHRRYYRADIEKFMEGKNMNTTKINMQLYASEYKENNLVKSVLDKNFGFELNFENVFERNRRILSLDQVKELQKSIESALSSYEEAMKFEFKNQK